MVQIPLRRAHRLRAITLASPTKKLRPQPTERAPTAWHTNDEYKNAEASEEASASSVVANASENRILPIPTPRHWLHQSCSYKRVSSVGRFYDGLRATQWRVDGRRSSGRRASIGESEPSMTRPWSDGQSGSALPGQFRRRLARYSESVVDLNAEIAHGALDLSMPNKS
jgi:hypothetical protein